MKRLHRETPRDEAVRMTDEEIAVAKQYQQEVEYVDNAVKCGVMSLLEAHNWLCEYEQRYPHALPLWERWDYYYGEW